MTNKSLKEAITEFAEIAKSCPENLQERCFTLLLEDYLSSYDKKVIKDINKSDGSEGDSEAETNGKGQEDDPSQEDFSDKDLHVKARKFLKDYGLSIEHVNQLFYKEGASVEALYDDLKTTQMAESQIRVALLLALKNAISSGEFEFNGESVRDEVKMRKCYDLSNYSAHYKNNKTLFEAFEKYEKSSPVIKLSKSGKEELAKIIKELQ